MQSLFNETADLVGGLLQPGEQFTSTFSGEESEFVRFNKAKVRQAGEVTQRAISIDLIKGKRHTTGTFSLTGDKELDLDVLRAGLARLRTTRDSIPEDPYLLFSESVASSVTTHANRLPKGADATDAIAASAGDKDLVGIYASGGTFHGFANSFGQRNWYENYSYNLDWSFYHQADKAVKSSYAGFEWVKDEFDGRMQRAKEQLSAIGKSPRDIQPGKYRVYLAPAAIAEVLEILSWGGFGIRAFKTKTTPLLRLGEQRAKLAPGVALTENTAEGIAPNFQSAGFIKPPKVDLIRDGALANCLVSPRSSVEYSTPTNGADAGEAPESLDLAGGNLRSDSVLKELGTGIYIGNLWYLNYSDRSACRTTGMTRFATFWVENGQISAPLNVMRFDETLYNMLGDNLVGLTRERDMILDARTYFRRSATSFRLPGAMIDNFTLTL